MVKFGTRVAVDLAIAMVAVALAAWAALAARAWHRPRDS
ncbi:Uncharacterised protein [Mycobacteroides abscessus subsp. abscessus]|nr:Uncharacterised protein [Mycobacteroides abscessus subsp. abscessus]